MHVYSLSLSLLMRYIYSYVFSSFNDPIPHGCYGQTAEKLKRFLDSLLQKSGKLRALVRDLRENYSGSSSSQEPFDCIKQCLVISSTGAPPNMILV